MKKQSYKNTFTCTCCKLLTSGDYTTFRPYDGQSLFKDRVPVCRSCSGKMRVRKIKYVIDLQSMMTREL